MWGHLIVTCDTAVLSIDSNFFKVVQFQKNFFQRKTLKGFSRIFLRISHQYQIVQLISSNDGNQTTTDLI